MTDSEYGRFGENLRIRYSYADTPFGDILIASTDKGICRLVFADSHVDAFEALTDKFPRAAFVAQRDGIQQKALSAINGDGDREYMMLHIKGTDFQLKVWKALLAIPTGRTVSYGEIARAVSRPGAGQAVGSAIGANPVSLLIPCHRVIRSSGEPGNYHWGKERKRAILEWEAAQTKYNQE